MDSFCIDEVKAEKASAILRYNLVRRIASVFRFVEVCAALVVLSWFSSRIPVAIRISSEFFRYVCVVVFSPWFVFVLGNAIILTLFAKSGKISDQIASESCSRTDDAYNEFMQSSTECSASAVDDEVPEEGKRSVCDEGSITVDKSRDEVCNSDVKLYRRSRSDNEMQCVSEKVELRRSVTEKSWRAEIPEAEMSDEELRDRVEAFIAKQLRFHREETKIHQTPQITNQTN